MNAAEVARRYHGDPVVAADDEPPTVGHVLVDEAQDLSPMQWRMLARRCPSGSMTLVGDFGQASRAGSARSWDDVLQHATNGSSNGATERTPRAPSRQVTLSVNYRTPAEIMELAHRVLAAAAPEVAPTRAVRGTGIAPVFMATTPGELIETAARAARDVLGHGTVAVVAPPADHAALVEALRDVGAVAGSVNALDAPVTIVTAVEAKGLEFDHVIVVEPVRLITPDNAGLRLLYVTVTRATQRLVVVHAEPLPEGLAPLSPSPGSPSPESSAPASPTVTEMFPVAGSPS